jgi:membrane protein DedA with SNARE-associated domain
MGRALIAVAVLGLAVLLWNVAPERVETSADAIAAFVARADPDDPAGFALFAALVFAASLVSEDLTCIGVGLLVAQGRVGFGAAVAACAFALWLGDLALYGAGRLFDLSRFRTGAVLGTGPLWILASRFLPGARLPSYVAAGALRYPLGTFAFWLAVGALLWTPVLVGGAAGLGGVVWTAHGGIALASVALLLFAATRLAARLATWRGRRLLFGAWQRWRRWEFWPSGLLYAPLVPWFAWLALRHGGLRVATAVNPAMPASGLCGEAKHPILAALAAAWPERVARTGFVPAGALEVRAAHVHRFVREHALGFPIVLKPDVGERGSGVAIVRDANALSLALAARPGDLLVQEYVAGVEAGLFYVRRPSQVRGRLTSITDKRMIAVTGDGASTLETLILRDPRAVCLAPVHLARHAASLARVPAAGEVVPLVEIGTHSRGALFLDGSALATPALEAAVDRLSRGFPGFHLGRYDVRAASVEALRAGEFRVVELNGLTAEPTDMYDPRHGVVHAWRALATQWRTAFEIGAENRARGASVASWREIATLWRRRRAAALSLSPSSDPPGGARASPRAAPPARRDPPRRASRRRDSGDCSPSAVTARDLRRSHGA